MKRVRRIGSVLKEAFVSWRQDHAQRLGAALAYYATFSIAPLILVMIAITTFFFEAETVQTNLLAQAEQVGGAVTRNLVQTILTNTSADSHKSTLATIIGALVLFIAAAGVFGQLKDALNSIWHVPLHPKRKRLMSFLSKKLFAVLMTIGGGIALIASIVLSTFTTLAQSQLVAFLPLSPVLWELIHGALLLGVTTLVFALLYRFVPDVRHSFKQVLPGAFLAAFLFTLGKLGLAIYLGYSTLGSSYGAAGSLILFLFWLYYSAQIFLYGAEVAKVTGHT